MGAQNKQTTEKNRPVHLMQFNLKLKTFSINFQHHLSQTELLVGEQTETESSTDSRKET